jgi:DNA replication ATP-dependent helicase Dna2
MAPRKRAAAAAASSKKPPPPSQPSQPAKFGIRHFFERQSQAAPSQAARRQKPDANPDPMPPPAPPPPPPLPEDELSEVSPEVTKTFAPKRVKFSPGMVSRRLVVCPI